MEQKEALLKVEKVVSVLREEFPGLSIQEGDAIIKFVWEVWLSNGHL